MRPVDDERLGAALRAIRRRAGLTQAQLAALASVSRRTVARIEVGAAGSVTVETVRVIFRAAGANARIVASWNGAALDRLLDERHAGLVEGAARVLQARSWTTMVEQSFSEYGERGSIDLLGWHGGTGSLVVTEVKSALGDPQETNRSLDVKVRLAPRLTRDRFGPPTSVSRILILPADSMARRLVAQHATTFASAYPARGREIRAWLRHPKGPLAGLWFLSDGHHRATVKR